MSENAMSENSCISFPEKTSKKEQCCCGPATKDNIKYRPVSVVGNVITEAGNINVVSTKWDICDYIGEIKVRLDIDRMNYAVAPGLYAVGMPGPQSPVLVSANYKLSFDVLRRDLEGLSVWILVIDTKGVNVWCAAGKGTFGTAELAQRVKITGLEKIVSTKKLIVPQLGAPGIAAHTMKAMCGFSVVYGPVRSSDIRKYLEAGMKADAAMRRVNFGAIDRLTVSWLELALTMKLAIIATAVLVGLIILTSLISGLAAVKEETRLFPVLLWSAILSGTVLNAVLLPYLPGRAFSLKGGILGLIVCAAVILASGQHLAVTVWLSVMLICAGISAFLALNFTGASTYTSLSGVKKEIRYSMPAIKGFVWAGIILEVGNVIWRLL
jgi:hypothetical protein